MARFDPQSTGLAVLTGGLMLGGALAAATPTRMRPSPQPEWRIPAVEIALGTGDAGGESAPWFTADTYEVLPAAHRAPTYDAPAVPPAEAHVDRRYADDGDWRQVDADEVEIAGADNDMPILAPEDDEPAPLDDHAMDEDTTVATPPA